MSDVTQNVEAAVLARKGRRVGGEIQFLCPVHDDHNPSASWNPEKRVWTCYACGAGGGARDLAQRLGLVDAGRRGPAPARNGRGEIVATYDYTDPEGRLLFQVVRYRPKGFKQRRPDGRGGWVWSLDGAQRVLYRLPAVLEAVKAGRVVYIVEGEKDADNLAAIGLAATTCPQGAGKWQDDYSEALRGARVVILPDNDDPGRRHAEQVARSLHGQAGEVRVLELDGLSPKGDVSDWLAAGGTREALERLAAEAPEWTPAQEDADKASDRPTIEVGGRFMRDIARDAIEALEQANDPPFLFRRGTALVRVLADAGAPQVDTLTVTTLKGILDRVADFVTTRERKEGIETTPARPPVDVVADILALPDLPFPRLRAVAGVPVFLPGGRLLARDGYDPDTGLLLHLRGLGPVRTDMPPADALALLLNELLGDFPFADEAGQAHALALLLLPFVRPMIEGPTPLHLIEAPAQGTGKGLLADMAALVATGAPAAVMALPRDEDEVEKRITSLLLTAPPMVLLDNVTVLRSTSLAAVLTATVWEGRRLGKSEMVRVPNDAVWLATGNNVELSHEITRRTVSIRLDAGMERPEERAGFRHPDLPAWVRENRANLVSACLSIVQVWIDAGMPAGGETLGRFEAWARVIGGVLGVAGVSGLLRDRDRLHQHADRETREWAAVCAVWAEAYGTAPVTAKDLFDVLKERALLLDLWGGRSALAAQQRIGHALAARRDRVFGGWLIRPAGRDA